MKKIVILCMILAISYPTIFANSNDSIKKYNLKDIKYDITGPTKPFFLEQKLKIKKGMGFTSIQEVDDLITRISQEMENLRLYDNIDVTYDNQDNQIILYITISETWNFIPFPYPKFSSETGGRLAMKLFWYDTLGTLTNTLIQGGINIGLNPETEKLELQTWDAQVGIDKILLFNRYFDINFKQSVQNESKDNWKWKFYESDISLGTSFYPVKNLAYSPTLSITARYKYLPLYHSVEQEDIEEYPFDISYSHGLGKSSVDWIGNFRNGYSYSLGNTISLLVDPDNKIIPAGQITVGGKYYKTVKTCPIAFGIKLDSILSINKELLGLGSNVRGVESGKLYGNYGLFANANVYIKALKIRGVAEAIFAPFFDLGLTDNSKMKYGTGADFILYVDKLKSLVARGTIGWDLTDFSPRNFTIDITSSLFF